MKQILLIALLMIVGMAFGADEPKPGEVKPPEPKPVEAKPEEAKPAAGTQVSKTGKMSAPTGDDKTIVAYLHVEDPAAAGMKKKKKDKGAVHDESISLMAQGEVATKLAEYITKNSMVEVSGVMADGKMTVSSVKDVPEPEKKKKKNK
ncbi:MAG: hypothetical protein WCT04_22980 [Planctomycetota bacterium]